MWKWGLQSQLPVSHPYKNSPPLRLWTPLNAVGLKAWFDAADASTITDTSGEVDQLDDKSGNGEDLTATLTERPITGTRTINGLNVLDWDGVNDKLTRASRMGLGANPDLMVFVVMEADSVGSSDDRFWSIGDTGSGILACGIGTGTDGYSWRHNDGNNIFDNLTLNAPALAVSSRSSGGNYGSEQFFLDGTELTSASSTNPTNVPTSVVAEMYMGGDNTTFSLNGIIGEMVFIEANDLDTRQKTEGYLAHKWGLTANLPVSHPYKNAPPEA